MSTDLLRSRASASGIARRRDHDTGFHEPFNGASNTTLPHPEADTSPNASISQEDVALEKVARRSRRRSFRQRNRRTISHGRITPQMQATVDDVLLEAEEEDDDLDGNGVAGSPSLGGGLGFGTANGIRSRSGSSVQQLRGARVLSVSTGRPSTSKDDDSIFSENMNAGNMSPTTSDGSQTRSAKKKGMLRRLRIFT